MFIDYAIDAECIYSNGVGQCGWGSVIEHEIRSENNTPDRPILVKRETIQISTERAKIG